MAYWRRIPLFLRMALVLLFFFVVLKFALRPPLPGSVVLLYMGFVVLGIFIYITLEDERIEEFFSFLVSRPGEGTVLRYSRWAVLVGVPVLVGWVGLNSALPSYAPPAAIYQAHPTPPESILDIQVPAWAADPAKWQAADIAQGKKLYEGNCAPCHGKDLDGKGEFAQGFRYPARPANFRDVGTIPQLTLQYVYWRVSEGGIQNQFNSAMPAWGESGETLHRGGLDSDDIWRVIQYLYSATGTKPR